MLNNETHILVGKFLRNKRIFELSSNLYSNFNKKIITNISNDDWFKALSITYSPKKSYKNKVYDVNRYLMDKYIWKSKN